MQSEAAKRGPLLRGESPVGEGECARHLVFLIRAPDLRQPSGTAGETLGEDGQGPGRTGPEPMRHQFDCEGEIPAQTHDLCGLRDIAGAFLPANPRKSEMASSSGRASSGTDSA